MMKVEQTLPKQFKDLANAQLKHETDWLAKENVVGVAIGHKNNDAKKPALLALVSQKLPPEMLTDQDLIPKKADDFVTDVVEVGEIFAGQLAAELERAANGTTTMKEREYAVLDTEEAVRVRPEETVTLMTLRQRIRPVMGGFSVGHYNVTAGTIATCCYDLAPFPSMPQRYYILSNNHVLANSNNANIGDPILQPGPYDGGQYPNDMIGRLSRFVPIRFITPAGAPCNYVDAAIAEVPFHLANRQVYWIGHVKDLYTAPQVGDIVQKTGRTTNFTTGSVLALNATVDVNYGSGRVARFCRQIITNKMSNPGDSGSLVTNLDEHGVGLLFAGSNTITILNNLLFVQSLLQIRIHEK